MRTWQERWDECAGGIDRKLPVLVPALEDVQDALNEVKHLAGEEGNGPDEVHKALANLDNMLRMAEDDIGTLRRQVHAFLSAVHAFQLTRSGT